MGSLKQKQQVAGRVTVGIPTRNRSHFLMRAIEGALNQTYRDIEVVVSDNASSDDTPIRVRSIRDSRLTFLRQTTDLGLVGNFNACLYSATGGLVLFCGDDDVLEPTAIERLSQPFFQPDQSELGRSVGLTWCPCVLADPAGKQLWVTESGPSEESPVSFLVNLYKGNRGMRYSGAMFRTSDAIAVGGMDEGRFGVLFDTGNLGLVALRHSHVVCVNEPLARFAVHQQSATAHAQCGQWQTWGCAMLDAHIAAVASVGDDNAVQQLESARSYLLANLTVDVLMRGRGRTGWIGRSISEFWKGRRFLFTAYVARRIIKDGWKLLRLR
jgi:glycosyltransferase involved in cell wall biosynthesis